MREGSPGKGKWQNSCKSAGSGKITRVAASHRLQQREEQQLPNSPTRGGGGGAWVPVAAEGSAWTVVSRERREQEERSGAQSSEHQLPHPAWGCRCVGGKRGCLFWRPHAAREKASSSRNYIKAQLKRVFDSR